MVKIGKRIEEMDRMRIKYEEERKRIKMIKKKMEELEEKVKKGKEE
jgi:RNase H-fold protein (predicted Holliday junction resolvase)